MYNLPLLEMGASDLRHGDPAKERLESVYR